MSSLSLCRDEHSRDELTQLRMQLLYKHETYFSSALQVTELNLDNCRATQIEGLTEEYTNLQLLSMINVGLTR